MHAPMNTSIATSNTAPAAAPPMTNRPRIDRTAQSANPRHACRRFGGTPRLYAQTGPPGRSSTATCFKPAESPHSYACEPGCRSARRRRACGTAMETSRTAAVELYWIPLGAGGHSVRFNGRVFEAIEAAHQHRQRCDLYHSALVVELHDERYTIEVAPSPDADEAGRGVVATGAVGSGYAGWLRLFRYEVRCRRGGSISD